jgi:hypothetical protein
MTSRTRPTLLNDLIGTRSGLSRLRQEAARRSALLRQVRDCVPAALASSIYSASCERRVLCLTVPSAGWASRLRLTAPELLQTLSAAHGVQCDRLTVRVRPPADGPRDGSGG